MILGLLLILAVGAKVFIDAGFKYMLKAAVTAEDFQIDRPIPKMDLDLPSTTEVEPPDGDHMPEEEDEGIRVDSQRIETIEKSVSTKDKMDAAAILLSKLTPSDISILVNMVKDGRITDEDFNEAKALISDRITEQEKEFLKELFLKYNHLLD